MIISLNVRSTLEYLFNTIQKYVEANGFSIVPSMLDRSWARLT